MILTCSSCRVVQSYSVAEMSETLNCPYCEHISEPLPPQELSTYLASSRTNSWLGGFAGFLFLLSIVSFFVGLWLGVADPEGPGGMILLIVAGVGLFLTLALSIIYEKNRIVFYF